MGCLDDATLDDLVQGRLSGDALRTAEAHIDTCASCNDMVGVLAGGAPQIDTELEPGERIGRHVVSGCLGRGAMGVVYLAEDPELGRRVALKLIRPGAGSEAIERTLREAQALARLAHPNVVAIYDVGHARGSVHFAMEFVAGKTLRAWLAAERRALGDTLDVMLQAGRGLAAAHAAGIVHRDFKPENVMVGDDGRVRVTDFGLARTAERTARASDVNLPAQGTLTRTGGLVGTPAYMAPEQLGGGAATELSDQFAFAVTLYEAITGERPFSGDTTDELAAEIRRGANVEPLRSVPRRVREAILRALDPAPERRFPTLGELFTEIESALGTLRHSAVVVAFVATAGALVVVAVVLGALVTRDPCSGGAAKVAKSWNPERAARVRTAFEATRVDFALATATHVVARLDALAQSFATEHRNVCEATHVRREQSETVLDARMRCIDRRLSDLDALAGTLEHADGATVRGAVSAVSELPSPAECGEVESLAALDPRPTDPARAARLEVLERSQSETRALGATGRYAEALARAETLAVEAADVGYRPAVAEAELLVATLARKTAKFALAAQRALKALSAAQGSHADRTAARAWLELLAIDGERGEPTRVVENAELAGAALERIGDPSDLRAALLLEMGAAHTLTGALEDAERELTQSLELGKRVHGDEHVVVSRTLTALGNASRARGRLEEALSRHERALTIDRKLLGPTHPALATHHHNAAGVLRLQGRRPEALVRYRQALGLERGAFGRAHPRVALTENSIAIVLLETADVPGAREHLRNALAIWTADKHPDRALALSNLGIADAAESQHARAVERFSEALRIVEQSLGADHSRVAGILLHRAKSERALGKPDRAREDLIEARRIVRLHGSESLEARTLESEISAELTEGPARAPPRRATPRALGSTTYGAKTSWDSE